LSNLKHSNWAEATDFIGGAHYKRVKLALGGPGVDDGDVSEANPLPIVGTVAISSMPASGGGLTDAELRAADVKVTLDGEAVAISGTVPVSGTFWQATQPVSGPLTDAQLRASAVPVSGTFWQATQPVSGPLTDTQLRASPVPVSIGASSAFTFVSAKTAAPAANAVQCDTGQLAAGDYELRIELAASDTVAVGKGLVVEHRNAANSANINVLGGCPAGGQKDIHIPKLTLALNERVRVIAGTAAGAASSMYVSAIGRRAA